MEVLHLVWLGALTALTEYFLEGSELRRKDLYYSLLFSFEFIVLMEQLFQENILALAKCIHLCKCLDEDLSSKT